MSETPKRITIITVAFNAAEYLERTIRSIAAQKYPHIEYIIIDGGSIDETAEIVRKYSRVVNCFISEPDEGIYHAMNKGLDLASGDYVWFINAGDEIYDSDTLSKVFELEEGEVYYGHTMIVDNNGTELGLRRLKPSEKLSWTSFQKGQVVSHQAFIVSRSIASLYDLRFKHSADTDWQIRCLKNARRVVYTRSVLCKFLEGGKSRKNILPSLRERFIIMTENYGLFKTILNHFVIASRFFLFLIRHGRF